MELKIFFLPYKFLSLFRSVLYKITVSYSHYYKKNLFYTFYEHTASREIKCCLCNFCNNIANGLTNGSMPKWEELHFPSCKETRKKWAPREKKLIHYIVHLFSPPYTYRWHFNDRSSSLVGRLAYFHVYLRYTVYVFKLP